MTAPTPESVRLKISEYNEIGEQEFLRRYSNSRSARHAYLVDNDELYDLKAIWGAAHQPPIPPASFHTNAARTGAVDLGFEVVDEAQAAALRDYQEGARRTSETTFFLRNPKLVADAKQKYGTRCMCCSFDFEMKYGKHGRGYIECHHKYELSQDRQRSTRLEDVAVICANCHKMIHRKRDQILSIATLKRMIAKARSLSV